MIYSDNHLALKIATFCYNKLNLRGTYTLEVLPLEVMGYSYKDGAIEINEFLNPKEFGITICHELVHCLQYERDGTTNEEEAYALEEQLYKEYLNESRKNG